MPASGNRIALDEGVRKGERGFSLVETLIALGLLASALIAGAQLFAVSTQSNFAAKTTTYATLLAVQKMEELRALAYGFSAGGTPLTDTSSDTTSSPETPTGGTGLNPSGSTLGENTAGYVDHIDIFGGKLGGGVQPPAGAIYTRRWSIAPLPSEPDNTIVMQVLVTHASATGSPSPVSNAPGDVRLTAVRARRAP